MSARAIRSRVRTDGLEGSPPPPTRSLAGLKSAPSFTSTNSEDQDYEMEGEQTAGDGLQLVALQEQLVAVMLDNQHLTEEIRVLRESAAGEQLRQQLEREKEKSRILMERLQEREAREKEKGEREARERERHTREKSLPAGDKSPSLPQRIRKRINQMHKTQSFEVDDGSPGPPVVLPPPGDRLRLPPEDKPTPRVPESSCQLGKYGEEAPKSSSTFDVVESTSRGRFVWKRRGLEKSKSLDQSEFLASLNSTGAKVGEDGTPWDADQRRESDSDEGDKGALSDSGGGAGSESDQGTTPARESVVEAGLVGSKDSWWRRLEVRLMTATGELLRDFSEVGEEEQPDGDPEGDPLTVKKLKENIIRFGCVMKPLTDLSCVVTSLLRWESLSATLLAFVLYLYSVLFGWVLPLTLLLAILKLSLNYLRRRGWTKLLFRGLRRREGGEPVEPAVPEAGLGDKFALVLQVARRVQNQLGAISNAAEKCKNLFMWEHEATSRLYLFLWLLLLASLLLPAFQLFTLTGLYFGLKLFVIDFIFYRYPRIRLKYDTTSRLWDTLPTDADLERRAEKVRIENGSTSPDLTSFMELFNLPATEAPLPGWQSGRRCTLVNRDRSLTSAFKNGRLYLTNSFLCFERSKSHPQKNLKLPLKEVRVEKANSYPWIPGGGMAIEVSIESTNKGYFFAGILNRDEVFEGITEGCRRAGASWCEALPASERPKEAKEVKEQKDKAKETKEAKENKETKETKETKDSKDTKEK